MSDPNENIEIEKPSALPGYVNVLCRIILVVCTLLGFVGTALIGDKLHGSYSRLILVAGAAIGFAVGLAIHGVISFLFFCVKSAGSSTHTSCPSCSKEVQIPIEFGGKVVKCPLCGSNFQVPSTGP